MSDEEVIGYPRPGTSPACGGGNVQVVLYKMPAPEEYESAPAWVEFAGCVIPEDFPTRCCNDCGNAWRRPPV